MKLQILAITVLTLVTLNAEEGGVDPFSNANNQPDPIREDPTTMSFCYETFSLPLAMAAKLQRDLTSDAELYSRLLAAVEKQTAHQESFTVLRSKSGQDVSSHSISEEIYPTEFTAAQHPDTLGVAIVPAAVKGVPTSVPDTAKLKDAPDLGSLAGVITPATPTSFATRNLGVIVALQATFEGSGKVITLKTNSEHIELAKRSDWGQGVSTTEVPIFEAQRIQTECNIYPNQPFLLGTINRPPNSKVDSDSANRVWFAFVTASLAKP
jgi:hypothetical protein